MINKLAKGTRFPMEIELMHYKSDYGNIQEALNYADGLAGLSTLYQVSNFRKHLKS
jgi:hypothetical protein